MGKQKNKGKNYKGRPEFKGLSGWEINYLKKAESYGHIAELKVYTPNNKDNK